MYRLNEPAKKGQVGSFYRYRLIPQIFLSLKGTILWLKSECKGQIVSKFDLGLLKNTYELMCFVGISMEIRMGNK